jgi:D-galactose 1-dehydrogenase
MTARPIALVGIGKIALDQHVPALAASADWHLAATCSRAGRVDGVPAYTDMDAMFAAHPEIEVVSLCVPPVPRFDLAAQALAAGRHVMLEKPPGATLAECHRLEAMARARGLTLFATWHSREAAMVAPAKAWLADRTVTRARITWLEDVRKWHPGQDWVFEAGGMGVFDPGINALSILTEILPDPVHLQAARLEVPANVQAPIAAALSLSGGVEAVFDWRTEGGETWDIEVETREGVLRLHEGGARMVVDDTETGAAGDTLAGEYPRLYAGMAQLVTARQIDMDLAPMVLVADAFLRGERLMVEPFHF